MLEVCVDSVASAVTAQAAGAHRVELCDNLVEGGTTPSAGMIKACRAHLTIPLHVLIRPRRGDFLYSDLEYDVMRQDIEVARQLGADGVVTGVLLPDGHIDKARTHALVQKARPMSVTFHRAFDLTPDPLHALADLLELGVDRLLTSGQRPTAADGAELIRQLRVAARGKMAIMPGGGINEENITALIKATGASEFHASARQLVASGMEFKRETVPMGGTLLPTEYAFMAASGHRIQTLLRLAQSQEPVE
ncbi:copper homeostasis protein CutC [Rufibacter ruber]|uniref:copper homeostasis protein CutC n=1 Tax=Rufibacter ruber TaxID=1783499 RepID=UPI00082ECB59|nr:copper homeostasis protein CutC [Rufibacter ruber]